MLQTACQPLVPPDDLTARLVIRGWGRVAAASSSLQTLIISTATAAELGFLGPVLSFDVTCRIHAFAVHLALYRAPPGGRKGYIWIQPPPSAGVPRRSGILLGVLVVS